MQRLPGSIHLNSSLQSKPAVLGGILRGKRLTCLARGRQESEDSLKASDSFYEQYKRSLQYNENIKSSPKTNSNTRQNSDRSARKQPSRVDNQNRLSRQNSNERGQRRQSSSTNGELTESEQSLKTSNSFYDQYRQSQLYRDRKTNAPEDSDAKPSTVRSQERESEKKRDSSTRRSDRESSSDSNRQRPNNEARQSESNRGDDRELADRARDAFAERIKRTDLNDEYTRDPRRLSFTGPGLPKDRPEFLRPYKSNKSKEQIGELPMMLYIPGIDGTGLAASRQFPTLAEAFDLRALSIPAEDRSTFNQLVTRIIDYLEDEVKDMPVTRPIYLLGESLGGILALAVASQRADLVDRVVVVNPATSFPRSVWARIAPLLPRLNKDLYRLSPALMSVFLGNPVLMALAEVDRNQPIFTQLQQLRKGIEEMFPLLLSLADTLPGPTLTWRLKLMEEGCKYLEPHLGKIQQRVLCLASEQDWLIPSAEEGNRLKRKLPRCRLKTMAFRSHALLQEAGIDLVEIMKEQGFYVSKRNMSAPVESRSKESFGEAVPIELPTRKELDLDCEGFVTTIDRLGSPVWLSTADDGSVIEGLSGLPDGRPLLLVGNHQTTALDLGTFVGGVLRQKGILVRGLAHPTIFRNGTPGSQTSEFSSQEKDRNGRSTNADSQAFSSFLTTYGAVQVGGRTFYKLMQNGEAILLYPGGASEAFKGKGEKYKLKWPERSEFIRMAAKFGATIVPFAGIGVEDSISIVADASEIQRIPIYGQQALQNAKNQMPTARRGASATMDELFIAPITVPSSVQRLYYRFMKPISTSKQDLDSEDRCDELYAQVKQEVESGIQYLLKKREKDPYRQFVPRAIFEASQRGEKAPSFTI